VEFVPSDEQDLGAIWKRRFVWASVAISLAFVVLVARLWQLQILEGETFERLSDKNRIRLLRIPFIRGLIFDRNGQILADNRPFFNLMAVPVEITDPGAMIQRLGQGVQMDVQAVSASLREAKRRAPFRPVMLKEGLKWEEVAWVETNRLDLPGTWVEVEPRRSYPYGKTGAHLLGYVGEITEDLLRNWRGRGYRVGDRIGKCGVERSLEPYLRGRDGGLQVEVDAQGRQLAILQEVAFEPGADIVLTLDMSLQQEAEEALGDRAGAIVAGDPRTGEILALVSRPSFDPNQFSEGITPEAWRALMEDPHRPLTNRALTGQYPPGSTFKIITAVAGLEEGVITKDTALLCTGHYTLGNRDYRCWKEEGHGFMRLREAIVQSCDVYFYQVGQMVGVDRLAKYSKGFGLGQPTGFDSDQEKPGLVPTSGWKKKRFGEPWHQGETLSLAIGQGFNLVTPLQQFVVISAVANGGFIVVPQVVKRIQGVDGRVLARFEPQYQGKAPASAATLKLLREALRGVVHDPRGTGQRARVQGVDVAGKTGTAQVVRMPEKVKGKHSALPHELQDHAWFVCFAPVEEPRIAVSVIVEHAGHGGSEAAPVAQRVLQAFFRRADQREQDGNLKEAAGIQGGVGHSGHHLGSGRDRDT